MKLDKEAQIWKTVVLPVIRADWVCKLTPAVVTYQFGPLFINMLLIVLLNKSGIIPDRTTTVG
jgi:hypothetical protein